MNQCVIALPFNEPQTPVHILLVDDDPEIQAVFEESPDGGDYRITMASGTDEALDLVKAHQYHIVLCNLRTQQIDGFGLTRSICRIHPQMPVVLVTEFGDRDAGRHALEAGASDFITKPLELPKLHVTLQNNIQRKRIEMRKFYEQRADVLFKAIRALASAIDAKSYYTGRHSDRVTELSVEIGQEMQLDDQSLYTLELAANVHDVGKIGTPDAVLAKPGKLTADEWECIKKHPGIGADILAGIDELREVANIVRHHHEHLDGSGYPDGLNGEAIPFLARILTVADAFESMTADRPYRHACNWEDALAELRRTSNTQFDAQIVESFARVLERKADIKSPLNKAA
ncbi:MAG: response regulator [Armatimonadetes bacterium]|nr:response regulator [Armatimonadota bacterium]